MAKLTPLKAIRAKCVWCCGGERSGPLGCPADSCALWPYRQGLIPEEASRHLLPLIRKKCLDCTEGPLEVRECDACPDDFLGPCPLHDFRFGKRPSTVSRDMANSQKSAPGSGKLMVEVVLPGLEFVTNQNDAEERLGDKLVC